MKSLDIKELTTEQKLGLTMVSRGYFDEEDFEYVLELVKNRAIGGIQVAPSAGTDKMIARIKEAADYPILICADMETGFPGSEYGIPSTLSLAALDSEELACEFASATAADAKKRGYNTVWSPVVDIIANNALCKVTRTLGDDPEKTSRLAIAMLKGFADNGMLACAKHFVNDSHGVHDGHIRPTTSQRTREELESFELIPYFRAVEQGVLPAIMTSHRTFEKIDSYPCSLSENAVDIIREKGFDGLVFTDSFAMMSILQKYSEENVYGMALAAGNDMILPNLRAPFKTSLDYLRECYKRKAFSDERLDDAVRHVIAAQNFTVKPALSEDVTEHQKQSLDYICKNSVCAVCDDNVSVKLACGGRKLFVVQIENIYLFGTEARAEFSSGRAITYKDMPAVEKMIRDRFPEAQVVPISQYPAPSEIERVCVAATKADDVTFLLYNIIAAYTASEAVTDRMQYLIDSIKHKISAISMIGNPYSMEPLPHVPRRLFAFGWGRSLEYILDSLAGRYVPTGKVPVKLTLG